MGGTLRVSPQPFFWLAPKPNVANGSCQRPACPF